MLVIGKLKFPRGIRSFFKNTFSRKKLYTIDQKKYDYFFGRVTTGRQHNIVRSAQNKRDLAALGIHNEKQLAKWIKKAAEAQVKGTPHVGQHGTTITRRIRVSEKGALDVKFFYDGGNMSSIPRVTTLIPKIFN